jgi:hypothetical protein
MRKGGFFDISERKSAGAEAPAPFAVLGNGGKIREQKKGKRKKKKER